jgi:hypothetical protein
MGGSSTAGKSTERAAPEKRQSMLDPPIAKRVHFWIFTLDEDLTEIRETNRRIPCKARRGTMGSVSVHRFVKPPDVTTQKMQETTSTTAFSASTGVHVAQPKPSKVSTSKTS